MARSVLWIARMIDVSRHRALLLAVAVTALSAPARADDSPANAHADKPGVIAGGVVASVLGAGQLAFGTGFLVIGLGGSNDWAQADDTFGALMMVPGAIAAIAGASCTAIGASASSRETNVIAGGVTLGIGVATALALPFVFAATPNAGGNDPAEAVVRATSVAVMGSLLVEGISLLAYGLTRNPSPRRSVQVAPIVTSQFGGIGVAGVF